MKTVVTAEIAEYIVQHRLTDATSVISKNTGVATGVIVRFLRKRGLSVPKATSIKLKVALMTGRTSLTPEQTEFIKANYLSMPIKTLAEAIGAGHTALRTRMRQLGLVVPPEIVERNRLVGQIKKGSVPPNKGLRQSDYMSPDSIEKTVATRFKKGNLPRNTAKGDGEIRIRGEYSKEKLAAGSRQRYYKWIRISLGNWKMYHVYLWEIENGPVPKGHVIVFRDGDTMNTDISNLEMITRVENMKRNTLHRFPEDIRKGIQLRGAINRQINKINKKTSENEQSKQPK